MLYDDSQYPRISFGHLNKLIGRTINRCFQKHGLSITNEQEVILRKLREVESLTQTELATVTGQDKYNISRTVLLLEKKGLICKELDKEDQRYCRINITDQGIEMHKRVWDVLEKWRIRVFSNIDPQALRTYAEVTELLIANTTDILKEED